MKLIYYAPGRYGYGRLGSEIITRFIKDEEYNDIEVLDLYNLDWDYMMYVAPPKLSLMGREPRPDWIWYTQWETDRLPENWVPPLNNCRLVITASEFCKQVYRNSGVTNDIVVVGHGIDEYFAMKPKPDSPFTFMAMGRTFGGRKGALKVLLSFIKLKAMGEIEDAKLIMKLAELPWKTISVDGAELKDVELVTEKVSMEDLLDLYRRAHVFVYPTHGEGWGLEPMEAMAMGCCTLVTDWSGMVDYITDDTCIRLPHALKNFPHTPYDGVGLMASVSQDDIMDRMVWCYEHQDEVEEMGKRASKHVHEKWTWDRSVNKVAEALRRL